MKCNARHIRWCFCIAAVLSCLVLCRVDTAKVVGVSSQASETVIPVDEICGDANASFCEKEDDMLNALREMGQWGIPSASVTMQGATGRVPAISKALQRISRQLNVLLMGDLSNGNGFAGTLYHTLSSKRFHSGYYIYYRCQMRC